MTTEEMRSKWEKVIDALPFGQNFEFDVSDSEAQIVMQILDERGDTMFSVEPLNYNKWIN